jgi:hypothetical protein
MITYLTGLCGLWLVTDGIISIRLYLNAKDESGKRTQSWGADHSIRLIRIAIGIFLIIIGGM